VRAIIAEYITTARALNFPEHNLRMPFLSAEAEQLLSGAPQRLPLVQAELSSPVSCNLSVKAADKLFPSARYTQAALAGLLLRIGCWRESHEVAQDIESAEGSYWHGILHRLEPDPWNSGYWFRRLGRHEIFPELARAAAQILQSHSIADWRTKSVWDSQQFIEWCGEAQASGGAKKSAAMDIQMAEWQLLFDWCTMGAQTARMAP
jgi:hypothetical protein